MKNDRLGCGELDKIMEYTVRESSRSKRAQLKMSCRDGLVVVIPRGFDHRRISGLLERNKQWIEKVARKIEQQKFFGPELHDGVPERIVLRAIGEEWPVDYRATEAPWVAAVEQRGNRLLVYGNIENTHACKAALKRWLNRKMQTHLVPYLEQLARERGVTLRRILVKAQKTRWASCSRRGTICLNLKTLFINQDLIRYIFIHELCHTVHMNHSARFWALVQKNECDFKEKNAALRAAWRFVPTWLDI